MVFQQFNLFPHLTVLENLTLGPIKARGTEPEGSLKREPRRCITWSGCIFRIKPTSAPFSCPARSAAARGHCQLALHGAQGSAV